jgi:hypothetical protein
MRPVAANTSITTPIITNQAQWPGTELETGTSVTRAPPEPEADGEAEAVEEVEAEAEKGA